MVMKVISYLSGKVKNFDKYLHLLIGTLAYLVLQPHFGILVALAAVAVIARWKEVFDKEHPDKHSYDGWDAYATLVGVVIGQAILESPLKGLALELVQRLV